MSTETTQEQVQRREERVSTVVPVDLGTTTGVTRDISASGIFFETDASYPFGSDITFRVELDTPEGRKVLRCHGSIVRIEPRNERVGVAVKITESVTEAL
jgi:Tfp pilus assembly protein PilZ